MTSARPARRSLSDKLRGMRFMKQREERDVREKLEADQRSREHAAHWTVPAGDADADSPLVVLEAGVSDNPMAGRAGRQSFGRFNAVLERQNRVSSVAPGPLPDPDQADGQPDGRTPLQKAPRRVRSVAPVDGLRRVVNNAISKHPPRAGKTGKTRKMRSHPRGSVVAEDVLGQVQSLMTETHKGDST